MYMSCRRSTLDVAGRIAPPGQEGWPRQSEEIAKHPIASQTGWWSRFKNISVDLEPPPRPLHQQLAEVAIATFLLTAAVQPLLNPGGDHPACVATHAGKVS